MFRDSDTRRLFEERVTLWPADSFDDAIRRAEGEARDYARGLNLRYLGLAQAFQLSEEPGVGSEVFSLIRESELEDEAYLTTFLDTGTERQGEVSSPAPNQRATGAES